MEEFMDKKINKISEKSADLIQSNIQKLVSLFPEVLTEGKIDFEKLRLALGDSIEQSSEKYEFNWHGKKKSMQLAQQPTAATLKPNKEKSLNWEDTDNLYIEGDNLEVLKVLQKSYSNKVKLIYVDPP